MKRPVQRAGFSLVEVSLALLVVGIGIMGVFALFPSGLESARLSHEETRAVLFANDTFDMYRTLFRSGQDMTEPPTGAGADFWGSDTIPRVTDTNWPGSGVATLTNISSSIDARFAPGWRFGLTENVQENTLRYRLVIAAHPDPSLFMVRRAKLLVWPGEFGPTTTNTAYMFYTEFSK